MNINTTSTRNTLFPIQKTDFLNEIENLENNESLKDLIELYSKKEDYKSSLDIGFEVDDLIDANYNVDNYYADSLYDDNHNPIPLNQEPFSQPQINHLSIYHLEKIYTKNINLIKSYVISYLK